MDITLVRTMLAELFLRNTREKFIQEILSGKFKSLYKKLPTELDKYGQALLDLGYGAIFKTSSAKQLACNYLACLVRYNCPLSESEFEMYNQLSEEVKKEAINKPVQQSSPWYVECEDGDYNLMQDLNAKICCAADYILKTFNNTTNHYDNFCKGKETPEQLTENLLQFIQKTFDVLIEDTNVAYVIPKNINKEKMKIYLPENLDLTNISPYQFLLYEVIREMNDPSNYCLRGSFYDKAINTMTTVKNIYNFYADAESTSFIMELDMAVRKYGLETIEGLLEPVVTLGNPMEINGVLDNDTIRVYGNIDDTVCMFIGTRVVILDKDYINIVKRVLSAGGKPCSKNKYVAINDGKEKILLWDKIFTNSKPIDGNYNNITKKNVK